MSSSRLSVCRADWMTTNEKNMRGQTAIGYFFLRILHGDYIYDQDWLDVNGLSADPSKYAPNLLGYLGGILFMAGIGMLLSLVMPVACCCFCCCNCCYNCCCNNRCCNECCCDNRYFRCGKEKQQILLDEEQKKNLSTALLVTTLFIFVGTVCGFVSNDNLSKRLSGETVKDPADLMVHGLRETITFMNDTVNYFQRDLKTLFKKFRDTLNETTDLIDESPDVVLKAMENLVDVNQIFNEAKDVAKECKTVLGILRGIDASVDRLKSGITRLNNELKRIVASCPVCPHLSNMQVKVKFNKITAVSSGIAELQKADNMDAEVTKANSSYHGIFNKTRNETQLKIEAAKGTITGMSDMMNMMQEKMENMTGNMTKKLSAMLTLVKDEKEKLRKTVTPSVMSAMRGAFIGMIFLVDISIFLYWLGLAFIWSPSLSTQSGSKFLMIGIFVILTFYGVLILVCTIMFLTGGIAYTEFCRYFYEHSPSDVQPLLKWAVDEFNLTGSLGNYSEINLVSSLQSCSKGKNLYTAFELGKVMNMDTYLPVSKVDDAVSKVSGMNISVANVQLLPPTLETALLSTRDSGIGKINFTSFEKQMNSMAVSPDPDDVANKIAALPIQTTATRQTVTDLRALKTGHIKNLTDEMDVLHGLMKKMKTSGKKLEKKSGDLLALLNKTESKLNSDVSDVIKKALGKQVKVISDFIHGNINSTKKWMKTDMFPCKPMVDLFFFFTDTFCTAFLAPYNGIWISLGWCLMLLLPSMCCANRLRRVYVREIKEPDEIPLTMKPDETPLASEVTPHETHLPGDPWLDCSTCQSNLLAIRNNLDSTSPLDKRFPELRCPECTQSLAGERSRTGTLQSPLNPSQIALRSKSLSYLGQAGQSAQLGEAATL